VVIVVEVALDLEGQQSERRPGEGVPTVRVKGLTSSYEEPATKGCSVDSVPQDCRSCDHRHDIPEDVLYRMCVNRGKHVDNLIFMVDLVYVRV
jgi:hypothetical protein